LHETSKTKEPIIEKQSIKPIDDIVWKDEKNGTFTDTRDGNVYKVVKIGSQIWMAENLRFKMPERCLAYEQNEINIAKFGYFYNWYSACKSFIGLTNWKLPSSGDFYQLYGFLGNDHRKVYEAVKKGGDSGFNSLLIGYGINYHTIRFEYFDLLSRYWSDTEGSGNGNCTYFECNSEHQESCIWYFERYSYHYNVRLIHI